MKRPAFWVTLFAVLLTGCIGAVREPAQAEYDFGPLPAARSGHVPHLAVSAPSWLAGTAMHYRLLYADPLQRRSYTMSRWSAPPAELLAQQLARRLGGAEFSSRCRLAAELIELEQVFERPDASHVRLVLRATLTPATHNARPLQTDIDITQAATRPDAQGGVAAARHAIERLSQRLLDWLKQIAPSNGCLS